MLEKLLLNSCASYTAEMKCSIFDDALLTIIENDNSGKSSGSQNEMHCLFLARQIRKISDAVMMLQTENVKIYKNEIQSMRICPKIKFPTRKLFRCLMAWIRQKNKRN